MSDEFVIRDLATIEEYRACADLQEETWGKGFSERVAPAILKVSQILGGVAAAAFDADGRMVAFVFGMTGPRDGTVVHWSDMLAVRPEVRDSGLGTRLKAFQRDKILGIGVPLMHWTFDPLRSLNAYLNFRKLGIVVKEHVRDMYGQTDSPLHRGIGTDRFVAWWDLASDRVEARLNGRESAGELDLERPDAVRVLGSRAGALHVEPAGVDLDVDAEALLVAIPTDIGPIMSAAPDLALEWREATRSAFVRYVGQGWEVREVLRRETTSDYLLVRSGT